LAIELAAARSRAMTPAQLLAGLADRFKLLRASRRADPGDRHGALRSIVDWSFELLDTDQQFVLENMAAFAGQAEMSAIEALCADNGLDSYDLANIVAELVDKSLVAASRSGGVFRYGLLETVRAYGVARLDERGDHERLLPVHAAYHVERVTELTEELRGPGEWTAKLDLDALWPDVRSAVDFSVDSGDVEVAVGLVAGLGVEALARGRFEVGEWADRILAMPDVDRHPRVSQLLGTAALLDWSQARTERGLQRAERGLSLHDQGDAPSVELAWGLAANRMFHRIIEVGDLGWYMEAISDMDAAGEAWSASWMRAVIAVALNHEGRTTQANDLVAAARSVATQLANPQLELSLDYIAINSLVDSDPTQAAEIAARAIDDAEQIDGRMWVGLIAGRLVPCLMSTDRHHEAARIQTSQLERLVAGAALHTLGVVVGNTIELLVYFGRADQAACLAGWLNAQELPNAGTGTVGMRKRAQRHVEQLPDIIEEDALQHQFATGAAMSTETMLGYAFNAVRSAAPDTSQPGDTAPNND
jgi:hypothetical protein